MRGSMQDLPAEWGGMNVALGRVPAGFDAAPTGATPVFRGLPDDVCPCPHWGYVIKGKVVVQYRDHEEVISTGDTYYLPPGHTVRVEEDTEWVEFSPVDEFRKMMEVVERNLAALQAGA
jgi:AraC-like ligand binding domain